MISCGFLIWGNPNASPSACERKRKSFFFSNCLALGFASAAASARPFAGCLPLSSLDPGQPKSRLEVGFSALGWEREGKCNTKPGESPVRPPKRNPRSRLPCNSKGIHPNCSLPEITAWHMGKARSAGFSARSAARRPVPELAPHGRCPNPGQ